VVSNREPNLHRYAGDTIKAEPTTGGVAVALDALLRDRGGVWVAHGAGDADRAVVDDADRVAVPPGAPRYVLRRVWLSEEEEAGCYRGFANEGLWPLRHIAHVPPVRELLQRLETALTSRP
jgi:trehalose 6-phosphate synthase